MRLTAYLPPAGAVLSGLLLAAGFAPLEWNDVAWVALIPLLIAARYTSPRQAGKLAFLAGAVCWLSSIYWLTRVTIPGWIALSLVCALFLVPFAVLCSWWIREYGVIRFLPNLALMFVAALLWTALEFTRSNILTGFPWNALGVTQYRNLPLIQIAAWGGVYALSALVVWLNMALGLTLLRYIETRGHWGRRAHPELIAGFLVLALLFTAGWRSLRDDNTATTTLRAALIQTDIPQDEKWDAEKTGMIYQRLWNLTSGALQAGKPDLIVWPETALPDDVRSSPSSYELVYNLATNGVPILVGSMDTVWPDEGPPLYFNSSFLFDGSGAIVQVYDKRHLVPFGEYVPLRRVFPFMKAMTPIQESFSAGSTSTVFRVGRPPVPFSALICFEDTVARLARESVRNGARLLINQTNDAWFDPSSASRQHMAQCVIRCAENRVPAIRAANTGVSCHIDRRGRIVDVLDDGKGNTKLQGFKMVAVQAPSDDMPLTFYTRYGDVFAWASMALVLPLLAIVAGARSRQRGNAQC